MSNISRKSSVEAITKRFDSDVERFSNLETGQQTTIDAALHMDLITDSIVALHPHLSTVLDVGCGAGNYTLKLLSKRNPLDCTLVDLSMPMLQRAKQRVQAVNTGEANIVHSDIRRAELKENHYDTIMAAAVLHHLRDDKDWEHVFARLYRLLKPGGSLWISDLIVQETTPIQRLIYHQRFGDYLTGLKDETYKQKVFAYIEEEDSPRSINYQMKLLERTGFRTVELLHKNLCIASFGAIK